MEYYLGKSCAVGFTVRVFVNVWQRVSVSIPCFPFWLLGVGVEVEAGGLDVGFKCINWTA